MHFHNNQEHSSLPLLCQPSASAQGSPSSHLLQGPENHLTKPLRNSSLPLIVLSLFSTSSSLPAQVLRNARAQDTGGSWLLHPQTVLNPAVSPGSVNKIHNHIPNFSFPFILRKCHKVLCINKWNWNSVTQKSQLCYFTGFRVLQTNRT